MAFSDFAKWISDLSGKGGTFLLACGLVVIWGVAGPFFHFSDTWQLVINTGTTIVTFLMVFLIQHTQNRDSVAMQLKLDELIRALEGAKNELAAIDDLPMEHLETLKADLRSNHQANIEASKS